MKTFIKIARNPNYKLLIVFFVFSLIIGGTFILGLNRVYAGDVDAADNTDMWDSTGALLTTDAAKAQSEGGSCFSIWNPSSIVTCTLVAVLKFTALLLSASATLFSWVVNVNNMNAVMNAGAGVNGTGGTVIYELWAKVRDLLNIAFILVLLFSAFATIFQVEKYNYKKLLLKIILMALLVNFSFPIARFIIDVSNMLMYEMIRVLFTTTAPKDVFASMTAGSGLTALIVPPTASLAYLLSAIVFTFLLAVTFLAIGVMLIIRMVALAILTIFSPIAFVGAILPGKASTYANDWWGNLFKYAFFGPIMIFMIYIASQIMGAIGKNRSVLDSFVTAGQDNAKDPNVFGAIAFFSIPVAVLWIGLGMAQKSSIAGASTVMGYAQKTGGWAGKKFSGYNAINRQYGAYKSKRDERLKDKGKAGPGAWLGDKANDISDTARGMMPFGGKATKRMEKRHKDKNKDDIDKGAKDLIDSGATTDSLAAAINQDFKKPSSDKVETAKQAAAYLRQDADERKMHIQNALQMAGGVEKSDLEHIINDEGEGMTGSRLATHRADQQIVREVAQKIAMARKKGEKIEENDIRVVSAFINKQMKRKVEAGASATPVARNIFSRSAKTGSTPPPRPTRLAETPEEKSIRERREEQKFNRDGNNRSNLGNYS